MRRSRVRAPRQNAGVQHIPQRADELTPAWFTEILGFDTSVVGVWCETISTDVGFMGQVIRCHLSWDGAGDDDRPDSVVVKVPTQVDENFAVGDAMQVYEREIVVYRAFAPSLGLPLPRYFYGAMDPHPTPWIDRPLLFLFDNLPLRGINWIVDRLLKVAGTSKRRYILVLEDIAEAHRYLETGRARGKVVIDMGRG